MSFSEIIAVIRDIAFISVFLVVALAALMVFWKASRVLDSARRAINNVEDITSLVSSRIVGPATAGSGIAFGAGKVAAFLFGLSRAKGGKGGKGDGERE